MTMLTRISGEAPFFSPDTLSVRFWGVRGSLPVCGPQYMVFGGNSCCVEVRCGERLFVVDAGSGIHVLGQYLMSNFECGTAGRPATIDLLLSHLHLDHVLGLPFFKPALCRDHLIRVHVGNLAGATGEAGLDRLFSPPLFPVTLADLPARFTHVGFRAGEELVFDDGVRVATCALTHPGGACAYRFDFGGRRVCYVSDVEHTAPWPPADLAAFVARADLMIFDSMYAAEEYPACRGWGHSTCEAGLKLCEAGQVRAMAAYHLHPLHDDEKLARYDEKLSVALPGSFVAREGLSVAFPVLP